MTETQASLNVICRALIGDTGSSVFTDAQINAWINAAIRDISIHFPRIITYDISTSADDRDYNLPTNFLAPLSVEYPQGEDSPEYLLRRHYTHPDFWEIEGYYDVLVRHDQDSSNPPEIYISEKPGASDTIRIIYKAEHNALSSPSDETTILDRHIHLIPLFVRWKAWQELATTEGMDPDPIKLLSATQEVNATRAERSYRQALNDTRRAASASGIISSWRIDKHDRTY